MLGLQNQRKKERMKWYWLYIDRYSSATQRYDSIPTLSVTLHCQVRGVLAVIFVKHKSMMTVIRVHVYTAVCTCHTPVKRDISAHKSMITIPTPLSKTTSWWAAVPDCCPCFVQHMMTNIRWCVNTYLDSSTTPTPWRVWSRSLLF
jgi:hypothetical protein